MCFSMRSPRSALSVLESRSPMMRSESRTEDTSGLVTMTAASANRMASVAPRSIPAGLSQITQSNLLRNSLITLATPCSVRASLSRVCEAGSSHSVSSRLSRMRACESLATPCTTLMRSNTTRRSHHQIEVAQADVEVDHRDLLPGLRERGAQRGGGRRLADAALAGCDHEDLGHVCYLPHPSIQGCNRQDAVFEPALGRPAAEACVHVLGGPVV